MGTPELKSELIARAREGDSAAIEKLARAVLPEIRAFVRLNAGARLRQLETDSDIVQSVCFEACADLHQYRGSTSSQFRKWLFTLALNKIQMKGRYHSAKKRDAVKAVSIEDAGTLAEVYDSFCTPSRHAAAEEAVAAIETAFTRLPQDFREVLNLACIMRLPHREVAAQLGRSEPAARKLLSRARARLAFALIDAQ